MVCKETAVAKGNKKKYPNGTGLIILFSDNQACAMCEFKKQYVRQQRKNTNNGLVRTCGIDPTLTDCFFFFAICFHSKKT